MVIIVVFKIVVLINLVYGTSWMSAIPDMIFTVYRLVGKFKILSVCKHFLAILILKYQTIASTFPKCYYILDALENASII